eukprot:3002771-Prymnesium_polylepis.1
MPRAADLHLVRCFELLHQTVSVLDQFRDQGIIFANEVVVLLHRCEHHLDVTFERFHVGIGDRVAVLLHRREYDVVTARVGSCKQTSGSRRHSVRRARRRDRRRAVGAAFE